jgi:hypothetical protein
MGEGMKHLSEEELVAHYYADDDLHAENETHLRTCRECARAYEDLSRMLGAVRSPQLPARPEDYGVQVWQSIQQQLPTYEVKRQTKARGIFSLFSGSQFSIPRFAYACAALLLLAGTFFAGKLWERTHTHPTVATAAPQQVKERVVLFVLDGHLDRSERLLVQLHHADVEDASLPLQSEARQLLEDNRLYRESLAQSKDPSLTAALDHLERVLLEVANSPDKLDSDEIARIEKELNTDGLLFQIRVLRARVSEQQTSPALKGRTTL